MEDYGGALALGEGNTSVLVRAPSDGSGVRGTCLDLIAGEDPGESDTFVLTRDSRPESIVEEWYEHVGLDPATLGVLAIGTPMRSTASPSSSDETAPARNVVRGVADLGEAIEVLAEWARGASRTVVFVDSLAGVLGGIDRGSVVGFIEEVTALLADGVGYFRIDPDRADAATVALCAVLVDAVVDVAGGHTVRWETDWLEPSGQADGAATMPLEDAFDLLADRRRRLVLHWLRRTEQSFSVAELAERIVEFERRRDEPLLDATVERTYAALVHVHLPKLEDASLVQFGSDERTVASSPRITALEPYLTITEGVDLGG